MAKLTLDNTDLDGFLGIPNTDDQKKTIPGTPASPTIPATIQPGVPPAGPNNPAPLPRKQEMVNTLEGNKPKPLEIPQAPEIAPTQPSATPPLLGAPAEIPKAPTAKESVAAGLAEHPEENGNAKAEGRRQYEEMRPQVTATPGTPEYGEQKQAQLDYDRAHPYGAEIGPHPGLLGKVEHGLAKFGNIAGNIIAPADMALIPGTQLHNELEAKGNENWIKSGTENQLREAQAGNQAAQEWKALNPQAAIGKTPDEQTFASLLTQVNPDTNKPYTPMEAFTKVNQAKQEVKPTDETKQPLGAAGATQHGQELDTLTAGMSPAEKQAFTQAYGTQPTDTHAVATKRLEDAKAAAALSGGERDRKLQRDIAAQNHQDQQNNLEANRGLESVQYRDKNGNMVSGSYNDAVAAGAEKTARKISPEDDKNNRMVYAQFGRWTDNIGKAAATMPAWDNDHDKKLAIRVMHNVSAGVHAGVLNIDSEDLQNAFLNNDDYAAMTPAGQQHMQNMYQLWSDAINLMKTETGGVPRGEHFLKLESAIMPQPEKTQAQNKEALEAFQSRILQDTKGHVRPIDMTPPVPFDAQGIIKNKDGQEVGYVDANGKRQSF